LRFRRNDSITMAPKKPSASTPSQVSSLSSNDVLTTLTQTWNRYLDATPQRVLLIDVFMAFLVLVGGLQFLYCVIAGNYVFGLSVVFSQY
jgi:oligosaccharyltransferase complex subunit epsilon